MAARPVRIGEYSILGVLGHGGMGVVYKAEQPHTQRIVAIKVLRSGLVGPEMLRRFEKEAQALGRLHHVGIAQIFEGGMEDSGLTSQPFFAMEFVEGQPITDYCEANKLAASARLELLAKVCDAVEHAHQNNVIHRDLKPSNILVDAAGQPKVLDFGVARVTDVDIQAATLRTEARKLIGTLPYMSPEQIQGDPQSLDGRSDVYALGVLGFRMLTGRFPFNISRQSIPEAVRAIQEEEPTRLGHISRAFRGDIETMFLKALEKQAARRYQSCAEFAADIRRFLSDEPIRARPPGSIYRFRKFARRNKTLVASLTTIFVVLVAGLMFSTWGFRLYYQRVEQIRMLAAQAELDQLRDQAANIGPPLPESMPKMQAWLEAAERLRPLILDCRNELIALHERSLAFNQKRDFDRRVFRKAGELAEVRDELARTRERLNERLTSPGIDPERDELIGRYRSRMEDLSRAESELMGTVARDHVCEFSDETDRLRHDALIQLERSLLDFFDRRTGLVSNMRRRLSVARTIKQDTILRYRAEWEAAARSCADPIECPSYAILTTADSRDAAGAERPWLEPQIGLVPIGRNSESGLWEFCHTQTGAMPVIDADGRMQIARETGLIFVLLPGGAFRMGASRVTGETDDPIDPLAEPNESPVHTVTLQPFFIAKHEMTREQWQRLTQAVPPRIDLPSNQRPFPVDNITWSECESVLWSAGLILPTEAQWEYAARGGTRTPWWTGSNPATLVGAANLSDEEATQDGFIGVVGPAGALRPNPFGLHDTLGNVAEWCFDAFGGYHLPLADRTGRRMAGQGDGGYRVIRGGSFQDRAETARVSARQGAAVDYYRDDLGVRPARALDMLR